MACPMRTLKTGPATVAVIAISPNPFLVMATSADMSPRQLPQASSERESRAYGNPVINPKSFKRSTIEFEAKLIQAIL